MSDRFIEVKVDTSEVVRALQEMQRRSLNLRPFMGAVGMIMIKSTHENFEAEGRPIKWKGWSPLTKERGENSAMAHAEKTRKTKAGRQRQYIRNLSKLSAKKILQSRGELKKSVVIGRITSDSVEIGSSLVYSRIHQLGGTIVPKKAKALAIPMGGGKVIKLKRVKMPARPYLMLQQTDRDTIIRVARDYLTRGVIGG
ncbi:phage virion morphogenesis protein [Paenibacillus elgii]